MKLVQGATFSHPVLAPFLDDVQENGFSFSNFQVRSDGQSFHVGIAMDLKNPGLLDYIKNRKARHCVLVEAKSIYFRQLYYVSPETREVSIHGDLLSGYVECIPMVIAMIDLPNYRLDDFNPDYGSGGIDIRQGDVLALGDARTFIAERDFDSLKKLSSIMQVQSDPEIKAGYLDVDLENDKIYIYTNPEDHDRYSTLAKLPEAAPILLQMVAVPALQEAFSGLKDAGDARTNRRWEIVLRKRIEMLKLDLEEQSAVELACAVLDGPAKAAFLSVDDLISDGG